MNARHQTWAHASRAVAVRQNRALAGQGGWSGRVAAQIAAALPRRLGKSCAADNRTQPGFRFRNLKAISPRALAHG